MLARAPGLALRCIVRPQRRRAGVAQLLALADDHGDGPRLELPDRFHGRLSCGLEVIEREFLSTAARRPAHVELDAAGDNDGLGPLGRTLGQLALGGRHSLTRSSGTRDRDVARLQRAHLPTAAALLAALEADAMSVERTFDGVRFPADPVPWPSDGCRP